MKGEQPMEYDKTQNNNTNCGGDAGHIYNGFRPSARAGRPQFGRAVGWCPLLVSEHSLLTDLRHIQLRNSQSGVFYGASTRRVKVRVPFVTLSLFWRSHKHVVL